MYVCVYHSVLEDGDKAKSSPLILLQLSHFIHNAISSHFRVCFSVGVKTECIHSCISQVTRK